MLFSIKSGFVAIWKEVYSRSLWGTWAAVTIVVAIAGPFGTFGTRAFPWRLMYWGALIAVAILLAISLCVIWRNVLCQRQSRNEDFFVSIGLSVIFGPFVVVLNRYLVGPDVQVSMGFLTAMGLVLAITASTIVVRHFLSDVATDRKSKATSRDRLFSRFSAETNVRLSRISSDNHHIRVVTNDRAEHRLLMRLRDAVAEVDIEPGLCVHRSHWVALETIVGVSQESGREVVELSCGTTVPVGPKYRPNLISAGVITE